MITARKLPATIYFQQDVVNFLANGLSFRFSKTKSINLLDITRKLPYILNRSLLARTAIRLVVRAPFFPD
jgi:hypothetical protein